MSSIAEYRTYLWDYLESHHNLKNRKQFFRCLNPQHIDNNPSMMFTDKYNICKCFSCGVSYDIFDIIGLDYNLNNFREQLSKLEEIYIGHVPSYDNKKLETDNKIYDYTNYYNMCIKNKYKTNYLQGRGISNRLIDKYRIGYDEKRNLVVFPINKNCYFARSTISKDKIKSSGKSDIWNKEVLKNSDEKTLVYVTEGIIDSLSLETIDPNIKTISINGVGNINFLVHVLKENNFKGTLGIIFDNDSAGMKASSDLKKELTAMNVNSFSTTLVANFGVNDCNDINAALIQDRELLKKNYEYVNNCIIKAINIKNENEKEGFEYE